MRILVSAATKHGSTASIAAAIADELRLRGHHVDLEYPEDVRSVEPYEACIIGSAVYLGRWMEPARQLIEQHAAELRTRPVWLFSSGPLGDTRDGADAAQGDRLKALIGARTHRVFDGALDRDDLGVAERLAIGIAHVPYGDFRDWQLIRSWGRSLAVSLESEAALPAR